MGQVSAPGYFAARQTATNACLDNAKVKQPSANVAPAEGEVSPVPPGFTNPDAAGAISATPLPDNLSLSNSQLQQSCADCVCD
jgi:hypothetical protein